MCGFLVKRSSAQIPPTKTRQRKFEIKLMVSMYGRASSQTSVPFISKMWADARVVDTKHPHELYDFNNSETLNILYKNQDLQQIFRVHW